MTPRDPQNFFNPEDFKSDRVLDDGSGTDDPTMYDAADIANAILAEWVKEQPKVYGIAAYEEWMSKETADNCGVNYTHSARIICIKEIKPNEKGGEK